MNRFLTRHRNVVLTCFTTALAALAIVPISTLPYQGDDIYNRTWDALSMERALLQVADLMTQWMRGEGRFFPTAGAYIVRVFQLFNDRYTYHMYLAVLLLALVAIFTLATFLICRNVTATVSGTAMVIAALQFRYWTVDGVSNMGGQIVMSLLLVVVAGLVCGVFVRSGRAVAAAAATITWSATITTYEVSLLMLPAVLALIWVAKTTDSTRTFLRRTLPLTIPSAVDLVIVSYLRSQVTQPSAAYTINLDGPVAETTWHQFTAALPSAQYLLGGVPPGLSIPKTGTLLVFLIVCLPIITALAIGPDSLFSRRSDRRSTTLIIGAGLYAWLVPSILVGVNSRWQQELPIGQGYIYTVYASFGLALITVGVTNWVGSLGDRTRRVAVLVALSLTLLLAAATAASNMRYANSLHPGPVTASDPN